LKTGEDCSVNRQLPTHQYGFRKKAIALVQKAIAAGSSEVEAVLKSNNLLI